MWGACRQVEVVEGWARLMHAARLLSTLCVWLLACTTACVMPRSVLYFVRSSMMGLVPPRTRGLVGWQMG